jgi:DNA-binding transcriptional MerR regulator
MQYRVATLAQAAGVGVDTIRFYQSRGLLPAPRRVGRHAVYSGRHLERLRRIRTLQRQGLTLDVIRRLLAPGARPLRAVLRDALSGERGTRALTRAELAAASGVAEDLIAAVEQAGLVEPVRVGARDRYGDVDVELARAALAVLREGFPLQDLLGLAIGHAEHVGELADRAVELFDRHVRRDGQGRERPADEVVAAFRRLMPAVTALVAHHFHRTVVARALRRLERHGETAALEHALAATASGRLEIAWR